jgi:tRNA modification GTPase
MNPQNGEAIDETIVTFFEKGRSFTGEETAEISCHGGAMIPQLILETLLSEGVRLAKPGEFTQRAFLNGRMDLTQAEGIFQAIHSRSPEGARVALRHMKGHLLQKVREIEDHLTWILAQIEANIDFAAEDIEIASNDVLRSRLQLALQEAQSLMASYQAGRIARDGFHVTLVGAPNVGKSSLLNRLVEEDRSIVSEIPGTTRDYVEVRRIFGGHLFCFFDTAGLRDSQDSIEKMGMVRSLEKLRESDLVLWIQDGQETREQLESLANESVPFLKVQNKCDLSHSRKKDALLKVSAKTGQGIDLLRAEILQRVQKRGAEFEAPVMQARQLECLARVVAFVEKSLLGLDDHLSPELIAFELQQSLLAIFELTGKRYDDQVLDRVFREFCLGK